MNKDTVEWLEGSSYKPYLEASNKGSLSWDLPSLNELEELTDSLFNIFALDSKQGSGCSSYT